jgi:hypothetical protein
MCSDGFVAGAWNEKMMTYDQFDYILLKISEHRDAHIGGKYKTELGFSVHINIFKYTRM